MVRKISQEAYDKAVALFDEIEHAQRMVKTCTDLAHKLMWIKIKSDLIAKRREVLGLSS